MHGRLPVTLVLTVRGALPLVLARLSRPAARALRCTCFPLPPPEVPDTELRVRMSCADSCRCALNGVHERAAGECRMFAIDVRTANKVVVNSLPAMQSTLIIQLSEGSQHAWI